MNLKKNNKYFYGGTIFIKGNLEESSKIFRKDYLDKSYISKRIKNNSLNLLQLMTVISINKKKNGYEYKF